MQTPVQAIDSWHQKRGFKRAAEFLKRQNPDLKSIGYHFVVYANGVVATGRHNDEVGAGVAGNNANTLHICILGTDAYKSAQWEALTGLVQKLKNTYKSAKVKGHRDCSPDKDGDGVIEKHEWLKTCPGFDVAQWFESGMGINKAHLLGDENVK